MSLPCTRYTTQHQCKFGINPPLLVCVVCIAICFGRINRKVGSPESVREKLPLNSGTRRAGGGGEGSGFRCPKRHFCHLNTTSSLHHSLKVQPLSHREPFLQDSSRHHSCECIHQHWHQNSTRHSATPTFSTHATRRNVFAWKAHFS